MCEPCRFIIKARVLIKLAKFLIVLHHIEPDAPLKLPQANGTKMHWTAVAFFQMIGSIHHAFEIDAMREAKHVRGFVREHFRAPAKQQLLIIAASWLAVEGGVVAG